MFYDSEIPKRIRRGKGEFFFLGGASRMLIACEN
jgi:hypothetical protein